MRNRSELTQTNSVVSHKRVWKVPREAELRLEAKDGSAVFVTLQRKPEGTAELFGTELAPNRRYELYRGRGAVYSWTGCEVC